jgi:hypothetical protein
LPPFTAVTCTETRQVPPAATVPLEKEMVVAFATGAKVGEPHPEALADGGDATFIPEGKESVNSTPSRGETTLVLMIVKVNTLIPFCGMMFGEKDLLILGGEILGAMTGRETTAEPSSVRELVDSSVMGSSGTSPESGVKVLLTVTLIWLPVGRSAMGDTGQD